MLMFYRQSEVTVKYYKVVLPFMKSFEPFKGTSEQKKNAITETGSNNMNTFARSSKLGPGFIA